MILPVSSSPSLTRLPPNQISATTDTPMTALMMGQSSTMRFIACIDQFIKSSLAILKRARSLFCPTKALTTRTPSRFSRMTVLTRSIFCCILANIGKVRIATTLTDTASTGIAATKISESRGLMAMAITSPPMQESGARTSIHSIMRSAFCKRVMSLVKRVISDEVWSLSISAKEKV